MSESSSIPAPRKPAPETGKHVAFYLSRAGFRVLPVCNDDSKRPARGGFGAHNPGYTVRPEDFRDDELVGVLCGPSQELLGDDWLIVADLDGGADRAWLQQKLGVPLPPTLTSKGGAHEFWRMPAASVGRVKQWCDALQTRKAEGKALDLKYSGGYAIQPLGDRGFLRRDGTLIPTDQLTRGLVLAEIATLPEAAIAALTQRNGGSADMAHVDYGDGEDWPEHTADWTVKERAEALAELVELGPLGNPGLLGLAYRVREWGFGLAWDENGVPHGSALVMIEAWDRVTAKLRTPSDWSDGERHETYWCTPEWIGAVYRALARCGKPEHGYRLRPRDSEGIKMITEKAAAEHAAMAKHAGATVQLAGYTNNITAVRERLAAAGTIFRYNIRRNSIEWSDGSGAWREWSDYDTNRLIEACALAGICGHVFGRAVVPPEAHVQRAVAIAAHDNQFDPVVDYLKGLPPWDGKPRIDRLFIDHFRCEDTLLARAAGRVLMCGAVLRALQPGCKMDLVVTIMGEQGGRKSSALRWLFAGGADDAYEFFSDPEIDFDKSADAAAAINGALCIEIAEVDKLSRSDQGKIKSAITRQVDRVRLPYARTLSDLKRRGVYVATINVMPGQDSVPFLSDPTGNRRWLAVFSAATQENPIDLNAIARERDQIFAEAVARAGDQYASWLSPAEEAAQKAANTELEIGDDAWEDRICDWLRSGAMQHGPGGKTCLQVRTEPTEVLPAPWESLRTSDVLEHALGIATSRDRGWEGRRVGVVLAKLGWRRTRVRVDGRPVRLWGRAARGTAAGATAAA